MCEEKEIEVNPDIIYRFPSYTIVHFKGKFIVVFDNIGKWIVLDSDEQLGYFKRLNNESINSILDGQDLNDSFEWVIAQIESKRICSTTTFEKEIESSIHLYLTNLCNLRCPHCYMNAGQRYEYELTTEEILCLVSLFAKNNGKRIVLSGGEVVTRNDLAAIINHAHSCGLTVDVLTNGTLWTTQLIQSTAPYINRLQISIDGYNEEENTKVRGLGNFKKAMDCLDEFSKFANIQLEVAVTPFYDESLSDKIEEYAKFGKHLLEKYSSSHLVVKFTGEIFDGRDIKFSKEQQAQYLKIAQEIHRRCYSATGDEAFVEYHKKGGIEGNCSYGNLAIAANGDIYFCPALQFMRPFGNIRTADIDKLFKRLNDIKEKSTVTAINPCKDCHLRFICGGECRVKYFSSFKNCQELLISTDNIPNRECTRETKEYYYDMMLRTNMDTLE